MESTEKQYTVLEAAKAAGMTKNTARYRLRKCPAAEITKAADGRLMVSEAGLKWLKETVSEDQPGETQAEAAAAPVQDDFSFPGSVSESLLESTLQALKDQLAQKDKQIDRLQDQLDKVTEALQAAQQQAGAAQALHAGTIQQRFIESGPEEAEPEKPARSFWDRLFNR